MENKKQLPDWNTAPKWAMYRAVDSDGELWYFDCSPKVCDDFYWLNYDGRSDLWDEGFDSADWQNSLEQRPSA